MQTFQQTWVKSNVLQNSRLGSRWTNLDWRTQNVSRIVNWKKITCAILVWYFEEQGYAILVLYETVLETRLYINIFETGFFRVEEYWDWFLNGECSVLELYWPGRTAWPMASFRPEPDLRSSPHCPDQRIHLWIKSTELPSFHETGYSRETFTKQGLSKIAMSIACRDRRVSTKLSFCI